MTRLWTLLLALLALAPTAKATSWEIVVPQSSLGFTAKQAGTPFTGRFSRFGACATFDPNQPGAAYIKAEIDLTSAATGADDRDSTLQSPIWFNSEAFPKAVFEASGFTPLGDNQFEATGTLTLKGVTASLPLQFTLQIDGEIAHVDGGTKIVRTNFNVGSGDFDSGKWISKAVDVQFKLTAQQTVAGCTP